MTVETVPIAQSVRIDLGDRSYDVVIGPGLLAEAGARIAPFAPRGRVIVVTDRHVADLHLAALERGLSAGGLKAETIVLPPGEQTKSFAGLEEVCDRLLALNVERRDLVVAFGGGVIGDLAGFAAGVLKRGVDFVQIPTTLLAQVDSSVGGKTAIDTRAGKNLVGLFYQPRLVLADLDVLGTLPVREMRAGYAEVVKYGLIDMAEFFAWCEANGEKVIAGDQAALAHAVGVSVKAKARVVAADERESNDARALLNLGHTFAHALETQAGYGEALLHGEAVAVGLALAYAMSARLGLAPQSDADRVRRHLEALGYTVDLTRLPGGPYAADVLLSHMGQDKKNQDGKLTLILSRGIGGAFVNKNADAGAVRALLADELAA
jgi:3-dehydroquinate synthase